jgi:hypothetical protein
MKTSKNVTMSFRTTPENEKAIKSIASKYGLNISETILESIRLAIELDGPIGRAEEIGNEIGLNVRDVLHLALDMYSS